MGKSNAQWQREWSERQKNLNLEEYRKKELHRVNASDKRQSQTTFRAKDREATARWRESKREKKKKKSLLSAKANDCKCFTHVQTISWESHEES